METIRTENFTIAKLKADAKNIISSIRSTDQIVRDKFSFFYRNADHYEICFKNNVVTFIYLISAGKVPGGKVKSFNYR